MHIKLKMIHNMWHEKHDLVDIKLILIFSLIFSVSMAGLRGGNKIFFTPQLNFSKSLPQDILKARSNMASENFAKAKNNISAESEYVDFKIPQLIEKLNDATPVHHRLTLFCLSSQGVEAANGLSKLGTPAIEPLTAALNDPRPMVRGNAALALGMIKDNATTTEIMALLDDQNPIVRMKTAMALASMDNPLATAALIKALNDAEPEVRAEAVKALAMQEDYQFKKALFSSLKEQSWLVRSEIKAALQ